MRQIYREKFEDSRHCGIKKSQQSDGDRTVRCCRVVCLLEVRGAVEVGLGQIHCGAAEGRSEERGGSWPTPDPWVLGYYVLPIYLPASLECHEPMAGHLASSLMELPSRPLESDAPRVPKTDEEETNPNSPATSAGVASESANLLVVT